jgi:hypothetical protein
MAGLEYQPDVNLILSQIRDIESTQEKWPISFEFVAEALKQPSKQLHATQEPFFTVGKPQTVTNGQVSVWRIILFVTCFIFQKV